MSGLKIMSAGAWKTCNNAWVKTDSGWKYIKQAWVLNSDGKWWPIWDRTGLPKLGGGSMWIDGRPGSQPGTVWGSTVGYTQWNLETYRPVIGVVITQNVSKWQGGSHGSGGNYGVGASYPAISWRAQPWEGIQTSPVLPCNFAPGEPIRVWFYGNGDEGDGKSYDFIRLDALVYGDPL